MPTIRAWLEQWRWRRFCAACVRYQVVPVRSTDAAEVSAAMVELWSFTARSGFLRDGRYPGGRHAERKIVTQVARMHQGLVSADPPSHRASVA